MDKIHSVEVWYNKEAKSWVVELYNDKYQQIGKADYVYNKSQAVKVAKYIAMQGNDISLEIGKRSK